MVTDELLYETANQRSIWPTSSETSNSPQSPWTNIKYSGVEFHCSPTDVQPTQQPVSVRVVQQNNFDLEHLLARLILSILRCLPNVKSVVVPQSVAHNRKAMRAQLSTSSQAQRTGLS